MFGSIVRVQFRDLRKIGLKRLVYFEEHAAIEAAIQREKNMKHWKRAWKVGLILNFNPSWADLYKGLQ